MVKHQTISAGKYHSLVIDREGQVWAFGRNDYGQLGLGGISNHDTPIRIEGLPFIVSVSAGKYHSLVLGENGQVWSFGSNGLGQLGLEKTSTDPETFGRPVLARTRPMVIEDLPFIVSISAGEYHSLLLDQQGRVWAFGNNAHGYLGLGASRPKSLNTASGVQGGLGDTVEHNRPAIIQGLPFIVEISAGSNYSLALDRNGHIWPFGYNRQGQLGLGDTTNRMIPTRIEELPFITDISAGALHALALDKAGQLWSFGTNLYGQLGLGDYKRHKKPSPVPGLSSITSISAGSNYSLVVDRNGKVWTFGANTNRPTQVVGFSDIINVSAGEEHYLALDQDGHVWSHGNNFYGQLGIGPNSEDDEDSDDNEGPFQIPDLMAQIPPEDVVSSNNFVLTVYPLMKPFINEDFRINSYEGEDTIIEFDVETTTYLLKVKYDPDADLIDEPSVSDEDHYINLFNELLENNEITSSAFHPEFYEDEEGNQALEFEDIRGQRYLIRAHA